MSEAGNEAAEGGGAPGAAGLPAGSSVLGKPRGLPCIPGGVFPVIPPLSRGASPLPRCYPGVWNGHVWPRAGGKWLGIAVLIPGKTIDRGPPGVLGCSSTSVSRGFPAGRMHRDAGMFPGADPIPALPACPASSGCSGGSHRFCRGREGVPSQTLSPNEAEWLQTGNEGSWALVENGLSGR